MGRTAEVHRPRHVTINVEQYMFDQLLLHISNKQIETGKVVTMSSFMRDMITQYLNDQK